jgi:hypothetical protein
MSYFCTCTLRQQPDPGQGTPQKIYGSPFASRFKDVWIKLTNCIQNNTIKAENLLERQSKPLAAVRITYSFLAKFSL